MALILAADRNGKWIKFVVVRICLQWRKIQISKSNISLNCNTIVNMKKIFFLIIVLDIFSCTHTKNVNIIPLDNSIHFTGNNLFNIYKIDSINSYYVIYAKKNSTIYKIVSKKEILPDCSRIYSGKGYTLNLISIWNKQNKIGEVEITPSAHINCKSLDDSTKVCIERGYINDIYIAENLKGLCITD